MGDTIATFRVMRTLEVWEVHATEYTGLKATEIERTYFWLPSSDATSTHKPLDPPEAERLYMDQCEIVRVRVDEFCDAMMNPVRQKPPRTGTAFTVP
jgi:hypothetical protein